LEEDHHVLDGLLLLPRRSDQRSAPGAQAVHLAQPLGRLLDHPQGVEAEVVDDALGGLGADPLD